MFVDGQLGDHSTDRKVTSRTTTTTTTTTVIAATTTINTQRPVPSSYYCFDPMVFSLLVLIKERQDQEG